MLFVNLLRFIHGNSWLGPSRAASPPTCRQPAGSVQRYLQLSGRSRGWPGTPASLRVLAGTGQGGGAAQGPMPLCDSWAGVRRKPVGVGETPPGVGAVRPSTRGRLGPGGSLGHQAAGEAEAGQESQGDESSSLPWGHQSQRVEGEAAQAANGVDSLPLFVSSPQSFVVSSQVKGKKKTQRQVWPGSPRTGKVRDIYLTGSRLAPLSSFSPGPIGVRLRDI